MKLIKSFLIVACKVQPSQKVHHYGDGVQAASGLRREQIPEAVISRDFPSPLQEILYPVSSLYSAFFFDLFISAAVPAAENSPAGIGYAVRRVSAFHRAQIQPFRFSLAEFLGKFKYEDALFSVYKESLRRSEAEVGTSL